MVTVGVLNHRKRWPLQWQGPSLGGGSAWEEHAPKPPTGVLGHDPRIPVGVLGHDLWPELGCQVHGPDVSTGALGY